jgi:hypothetical protein
VIIGTHRPRRPLLPRIGEGTRRGGVTTPVANSKFFFIFARSTGFGWEESVSYSFKSRSRILSKLIGVDLIWPLVETFDEMMGDYAHASNLIRRAVRRSHVFPTTANTVGAPIANLNQFTSMRERTKPLSMIRISSADPCAFMRQ